MKIMWLFLVWVVGTISLNAYADSEFSSSQIRNMVKQGKILSLETILKNYPQDTSGRLLDLEVESEHGQIIYELEFLKKNGDVVELKIDAATGNIIEQEVEH